MALPVAASSLKRFPPQSGTYSAPPATAGVADTSPPVVKTHFALSPATFPALRVPSAAWFRVLERFWPAIVHSGAGGSARAGAVGPLVMPPSAAKSPPSTTPALTPVARMDAPDGGICGRGSRIVPNLDRGSEVVFGERRVEERAGTGRTERASAPRRSDAGAQRGQIRRRRDPLGRQLAGHGRAPLRRDLGPLRVRAMEHLRVPADRARAVG